MLETISRTGAAAMTKTKQRQKRVDGSYSDLETDLGALVDRHADHSAIREAMERMGDNAQRIIYTTYPACTSNA